MDARAARTMLSQHLNPSKSGCFEILRLPGELRTHIYEHILSYPPLIFAGSSMSSFSTYEKELASADANNRWPLYEDSRTPGLNEMLAVTQVNKQLYGEALPVFYSVNSFDLPEPQFIRPFAGILYRSDPLAVSHWLPLCIREPSRSTRLLRLTIAYECADYWVPPGL